MTSILDNMIIGPSSVAIDRVAVGYISEDGVEYSPEYETKDIPVDQENFSLGDLVLGSKGSFSFKSVEITDALLAKSFNLNDQTGSSITVPAAGKAYSLAPKRLLPVYQIERWGPGPAGKIWHHILGGSLTKPPKLGFKRKDHLTLDLQYELRRLACSMPDGVWHSYTAVSGAPTCTVTAGTGTLILTFNKPMLVTALKEHNFTLTGTCTDISFGTASAYGTTVVDPCKIILTGPTDVTVRAGLTAADGTALAADVEYTPA